MRTTGTFIEVHDQAGRYHAGDECNVMNPVVRREDNQWMIESRLEPSPDCDIEVSLEDFCGYWFAGDCPGDSPTPDEIAEWVDAMIHADLNGE